MPDLPSVANSIAGLETIGFTDTTAAQHGQTPTFKYKQPSTSHSADNGDFCSFIHGYTIMLNSSNSAGSTDRESMTNLGISEHVQDRDFNPRLEGLKRLRLLDLRIRLGLIIWTLVRMTERRKEWEPAGFVDGLWFVSCLDLLILYKRTIVSFFLLKHHD